MSGEESQTELDLNELISHVSDIKVNRIRDTIKQGFPDELIVMMRNRDFVGVRTGIMDVFSDLENLMIGFAKKSSKDVSIFDIPAFQKWYQNIDSFENSVTIINAIETLLDHVKSKIQTIDRKNCVSLFLILYLPVLQEPEPSMIILSKACDIISNFSSSERFEFALIIQESIQCSSPDKQERARLFKIVIQLFQQYLTLLIFSSEEAESVTEPIISVVQTLSILAAINETNNFVPYYEFYNESVEETLDLKEDYPKWKSNQGAATKGDVLKIESMIQMRHELQDSFFRAMFIGVNNPYLQRMIADFFDNLDIIVDVRRSHVIRDALFQLQGKTNHDLKKQLRVSFLEEDGVDEGGIQKGTDKNDILKPVVEFFQIVAKEIFDPAYGLFQTNPESRMSWFSYWDTEPEQDMLDEYNLLGKLIGLAFYNGVALDINFPPALYKKILNSPVSLDDVIAYDPDMGAGLTKLLAYEGNVEEDYSRTFSVDTLTPFGKRKTVDLVPNGSNIPVTNENRIEFVDRYVNFIFNESLKSTFSAFQDGLLGVLDGSGISLFRPEELQELICGSPSLDFKILEESTIYDGYESDTQIIRYFWEIVHSFTDEQKKQLLVFTTGSDRVPIGGLGKLQFVIAKNGGDSDRLPTSHTCFNALLLSEYSSKEKLKERLLIALENRNCGFYLT